MLTKQSTSKRKVKKMGTTKSSNYNSVLKIVQDNNYESENEQENELLLFQKSFLFF